MCLAKISAGKENNPKSRKWVCGACAKTIIPSKEKRVEILDKIILEAPEDVKDHFYTTTTE